MKKNIREYAPMILALAILIITILLLSGPRKASAATEFISPELAATTGIADIDDKITITAKNLTSEKTASAKSLSNPNTFVAVEPRARYWSWKQDEIKETGGQIGLGFTAQHMTPQSIVLRASGEVYTGWSSTDDYSAATRLRMDSLDGSMMQYRAEATIGYRGSMGSAGTWEVYSGPGYQFMRRTVDRDNVRRAERDEDLQKLYAIAGLRFDFVGGNGWQLGIDGGVRIPLWSGQNVPYRMASAIAPATVFVGSAAPAATISVIDAPDSPQAQIAPYFSIYAKCDRFRVALFAEYEQYKQYAYYWAQPRPLTPVAGFGHQPGPFSTKASATIVGFKLSITL